MLLLSFVHVVYLNDIGIHMQCHKHCVCVAQLCLSLFKLHPEKVWYPSPVCTVWSLGPSCTVWSHSPDSRYSGKQKPMYMDGCKSTYITLHSPMKTSDFLNQTSYLACILPTYLRCWCTYYKESLSAHRKEDMQCSRQLVEPVWCLL